MNGNKNENARPKAPKQKMSKILKNNLLLLKKTAKLTPDYFILTFVEGVVWGIINSAISLFTVYLFDALDVGAPFSRMASIIGIMALFYIVAYAFSNWYWHYYQPLLKQKLINRLNSEHIRSMFPAMMTPSFTMTLYGRWTRREHGQTSC